MEYISNIVIFEIFVKSVFSLLCIQALVECKFFFFFPFLWMSAFVYLLRCAFGA